MKPRRPWLFARPFVLKPDPPPRPPQRAPHFAHLLHIAHMIEEHRPLTPELQALIARLDESSSATTAGVSWASLYDRIVAPAIAIHIGPDN
jgi:hypothetical protein